MLLLVLGGVLLLRSRDGGTTAGPTPTTATTTAATTATATPTGDAPTGSTVPPLPSSVLPSGPAPSGPGASAQDVAEITALAQALVAALNTGDPDAIAQVTCGTLLDQVRGEKPGTPETQIVYDRTEDVQVDGDAGTAAVFASDDATPPSAATMEVERVDGAWRACNLR